jgi:hypothetical protein
VAALRRATELRSRAAATLHSSGLEQRRGAGCWELGLAIYRLEEEGDGTAEAVGRAPAVGAMNARWWWSLGVTGGRGCEATQ